ncbi:3387_t:CDS:2 [Diversispora eburnea]|uniref:3387_t:CDS:1 n=1 Tax=Diversispora eburnea TaxID=1213867 RepID=A0A9N8YSL6_9GLOM|nr:3387_t:CDS:2 [Diversispora eburnea]
MLNFILGNKKKINKFSILEPNNFTFIKIFRILLPPSLPFNNYFPRTFSNSKVLLLSKKQVNSDISKTIKNKLNDKRYLGLNKIKIPEEVPEILEKNKKFYLENYKNKINYELLEDFPEWLKGLGLKPLFPYFEGKKWQDIIELKWQDLEKMGIHNKFIRFRLVKNFWRVKLDQGITLPLKGLKKNIDNEEIEEIEEIEGNVNMRKMQKELIKVDLGFLEEYWLHSIGLKYGIFYPYFQSKKWYEMMELSSSEILSLGIVHNEMRKKMSKAFKIYKFAVQ